MNLTVTFPVPGAAMAILRQSDLMRNPAVCGIGGDAIRACAALKAATAKKQGIGISYTVVCDPDAADIIGQFCGPVGQAFMRSRDPGVYNNGKALVKVAEKIEYALTRAASPH